MSPLRKGDDAVMLPNPQARKWKKAQDEDQLDVRSYVVRTEDGNVFRRNRRHLKTYDPPPDTHTAEVEVGPSKNTVTAEGAVKDSEEPPIQPPQHVSVDVSIPPSSPIVRAPAPVKDPPVGVAAATRSSIIRQIKLPGLFKDFMMTYFHSEPLNVSLCSIAIQELSTFAHFAAIYWAHSFLNCLLCLLLRRTFLRPLLIIFIIVV